MRVAKHTPRTMPVHAKKQTPGWKCPKCGRAFAQKSAYHACGQFTVEGYLTGKKPEALALFNVLTKTARSLGPVNLSAGKTQISFRVNTTFMMIALSGRQLVGYLFLPREAPAPFFKKITTASARRFVHHLRIADAQTITGKFANLMSEAIEAQLDAGEKPTSSPSQKRPLSIGEEINLLYRAERRA